MKKGITMLMVIAVLSGCNMESGVYSGETAESSGTFTQLDASFSASDEEYTNECTISLGESVTIQGAGAWFENGCLSVTEGGIYNLSGTLSDGMIYVSSDEPVKLVLNGVSVNNPNGAALFCADGQLTIEAANGTENSFSDGEYTYERDFESKSDSEPSAAIFAKDDLEISGSGKLTVTSGENNGIVCKDALSVSDCSLYVSAANNGIKGKDSVYAENASITVKSAGDCIKTDNTEKGAMSLTGCALELNSGEDGIQADGLLTLSGGTVNIETTGNIKDNSDLSSKGIKAGEISAAGCTVTINSTDHSIHSNGAAVIESGSYSLSSSSGKGVSAHGDLTVNGGEISVLNSTEGLESKAVMNINGGKINVFATDDGLNTGGGTSFFGWNNSSDEEDSGDHTLNINGGYIYINASGDGIDSNGDINITGGTVIVCGPTADGDGPLDCGDNGNKITVTGGVVLALGSTGMMEAPEENYIASKTLGAAAGSVITVADGSGNVLASAVLPKKAQGLVFSDGTVCEGYKIYVGGTLSDAPDENGVVTSGTINGGTEAEQTEVTGGFGNFGGFGGGQKPGRGDRGDFQPPEDMTFPQEADGNPPELPDGMTFPENMTPPDGGSAPDFPENNASDAVSA